MPGTVDLALNVDDHLPLHGSLELNNQNTPETKPLRAIAALRYSNLFAQFDSVSVQYQVAPQNTGEVNVVAANYAWRPLESDLRPSVSFVNSNSNEGEAREFCTLPAMFTTPRCCVLFPRPSSPFTTASCCSVVRRIQ